MSLDIASERVCYVHCNCCNTILVFFKRVLYMEFIYTLQFTWKSTRRNFSIFGKVWLWPGPRVSCTSQAVALSSQRVNVPCTSMFNTVTVRCGCCASLLSLNTGALPQTAHLQNVHKPNSFYQDLNDQDSESSKCNKVSVLESPENEQPRTLSVHAAAIGKRQRPPSAYNKFIKEEIRRIKANNPDIGHREAFSTAAKNWAHLPHTHFGLPLNNNMNDVSRQGI